MRRRGWWVGEVVVQLRAVPHPLTSPAHDLCAQWTMPEDRPAPAVRAVLASHLCHASLQVRRRGRWVGEVVVQLRAVPHPLPSGQAVAPTSLVGAVVRIHILLLLPHISGCGDATSPHLLLLPGTR